MPFHRQFGPIKVQLPVSCIAGLLVIAAITLLHSASCSLTPPTGARLTFNIPDTQARGGITFNLPALPDYQISAIEITVSAPDMATISQSFAPQAGTISLEVPPGLDRNVSVFLRYQDIPGAPLIGRHGKATVDIVAGKDNPVTIKTLPETKLVFPDAVNGQLAQFDDPSGTGYLSTPLSSPFSLCFDRDGRFYASSNGTDVCAYGSLSDTPTMITMGMSNMSAFACDSSPGDLYVLGTETTNGMHAIKRLVLADGIEETVFTSGDYGITLDSYAARGLAFDGDDVLYFFDYNSTNGQYGLVKFDRRQANPVVARQSLAALGVPGGLGPTGLLFHNGSLYAIAASAGNADQFGILVKVAPLSLSAQAVRGHDPSSGAPPPNAIAGPMFFAATLNRRITIVNEWFDPIDGDSNALLSLDDLDDEAMQVLRTPNNGFYMNYIY